MGHNKGDGNEIFKYTGKKGLIIIGCSLVLLGFMFLVEPEFFRK